MLSKLRKNKLQLSKKSKIILGIDPGTVIMGVGIIEVCGSFTSLLMMDVLKFTARTDIYLRLQLIHQKVSDILREYRPDEFAIEAPFFGKNVQSMLKLGRAQGVAIAAAMQSGVPVCEYSPRKVKQSITGNGNADKMQVFKMLQRILKFEEVPKHLDATDALAVAVCHSFQSRLTAKDTRLSGWNDFLTKNPHRVK